MENLRSAIKNVNSAVAVAMERQGKRNRIKAKTAVSYDTAVSFGMRITGLEPARRGHQNLNLARLPIPPYPHTWYYIVDFQNCLEFLRKDLLER